MDVGEGINVHLNERVTESCGFEVTAAYSFNSFNKPHDVAVELSRVENALTRGIENSLEGYE